MARVTVEDCVVKVPNRFELVVLASGRARELAAGANITVPRDNDKNPVVALREIAEETVAVSALKETVIRGLQRMSPIENDEDLDDDVAMVLAQDTDDMSLIASEEDDDDFEDDEEDAADEGKKEVEVEE